MDEKNRLTSMSVQIPNAPSPCGFRTVYGTLGRVSYPVMVKTLLDVRMRRKKGVRDSPGRGETYAVWDPLIPPPRGKVLEPCFFSGDGEKGGSGKVYPPPLPVSNLMREKSVVVVLPPSLLNPPSPPPPLLNQPPSPPRGNPSTSYSLFQSLESGVSGFISRSKHSLPPSPSPIYKSSILFSPQ